VAPLPPLYPPVLCNRQRVDRVWISVCRQTAPLSTTSRTLLQSSSSCAHISRRAGVVVLSCVRPVDQPWHRTFVPPRTHRLPCKSQSPPTSRLVSCPGFVGTLRSDCGHARTHKHETRKLSLFLREPSPQQTTREHCTHSCIDHRRTGSVQLADQGQRGCGQSNNRPPACSEYWSVHWLATTSRQLYVEAIREDSRAPGRGTHVDDEHQPA